MCRYLIIITLAFLDHKIWVNCSYIILISAANEVYERSLCNHRRAYKFFTDSVSAKCQFPAVPCESYDHFIEGKCFPCDNIKDCSNMGYYADKFSGRGTLYLLTREEEPFCGEYRSNNLNFEESVDEGSFIRWLVRKNLFVASRGLKTEIFKEISYLFEEGSVLPKCKENLGKVQRKL